MASIDSSSPEVTVSVVSHGQGVLLAPLLEQLERVSRTLPMHVLVTLNLPEPRPHIQSRPGFDITWIENATPLGFGENHNAAFHRSKTKYFAVLNPDLRLDANSLPPLIACVAQKPGVAGPRVLAPAGTIEDSARHVPSPLRLFGRWWHRRFEADYPAGVAEQQVDWLAGMCLVFDADTYRRVGGFDERYRLYCEDVDICLRIHLEGLWVTWIQDAVVVHEAQRTSHSRWRYRAWHVRSLLRLLSSVTYWRFRVFGRTIRT